MDSIENNPIINIKGLAISYTDQGPEEAPVIIFIHGFPFNKSMWNKQVEALKDAFRIITYDIRGHGETGSGDGTYSIELFVSDLIGFMDQLRIDKASLCGLSMGGYIVLNAIQSHPDRFDAVVLSDTQCLADTPEAKETRLQAIENIQRNGVKKYAEESVKNFFTEESFITNALEVEKVKQMIERTTEQSLCKTLSALMNRKETCSRLSEIKVPALILVGDDDKITPLSAAEKMHNGIRDSLMKVIDHAGHLSCLENPKSFDDQLIRFFENVHKKELEMKGS